MTTAAADTGHSTDEVIRQTVRALRSAHNVDALLLAKQLGISRQSLYNRLNGTAPFLAAEIATLAQFFGCTVQEIYDGVVRITPTPPRALTGARTAGYRQRSRPGQSHLALLRGGGGPYRAVSGRYGSSPPERANAAGRTHSGTSGMVNYAHSA